MPGIQEAQEQLDIGTLSVPCFLVPTTSCFYTVYRHTLLALAGCQCAY